jgi:hypothetical protein
MAATGVCRPFAQIIDEVQEAASKGLIVETTATPGGVIITTKEV